MSIEEMTHDDIIRMAKEAGVYTNKTSGELHGYKHSLKKFAELVAEREREACAKVCDEMDHDGVMIAADCAATIRARVK
jgi:hypothetical protein